MESGLTDHGGSSSAKLRGSSLGLKPISTPEPRFPWYLTPAQGPNPKPAMPPSAHRWRFAAGILAPGEHVANRVVALQIHVEGSTPCCLGHFPQQ